MEHAINILEKGDSLHEDKSIKMINVIKNSTNHLKNFVEHIKTKTQDIDLKIDTHNIAMIIDSAINSVNVLAEENNVEFKKEYNDYEIECDMVHVKEMLGNIFRNSIEAMPSGGIIRIKTKIYNRLLKISIEDSGVGIPKEHLGNIFEPFLFNKENQIKLWFRINLCV